MKNLFKFSAAALVIKLFLFAVAASELPESNHHQAINQAINEVTK